jgi:hypothetical protein
MNCALWPKSGRSQQPTTITLTAGGPGVVEDQRMLASQIRLGIQR